MNELLLQLHNWQDFLQPQHRDAVSCTVKGSEAGARFWRDCGFYESLLFYLRVLKS